VSRPVAAVCIVIPTWNGATMLRRCLQALDEQTWRPQQVIVVDNGSIDGTAEMVATTWPDVEVLALPANEGFAGGCNRGVAAAGAGLDVVLLNNDATPHPPWLEVLARANDEAAAAVGVLSAKIVSASGTIDSAGDFLTSWGMPFQRGHGEPDDGRYDVPGPIFSACGGASLYRRRMLDDVGVLDETFFAYYEDVDLCFRARLAGWDVVYVPEAVVSHVGGGTSSRVTGFRRYHATRNLWFLLLKNTPTPMLPLMLTRTAAVQCAWLLGAVRHGELGTALRAHQDAARQLGAVLSARRSVQRRRVVPSGVVRSWLPRRRRDVSRPGPEAAL
jgi:hypothetical protein